jgi:hypothetical protein
MNEFPKAELGITIMYLFNISSYVNSGMDQSIFIENIINSVDSLGNEYEFDNLSRRFGNRSLNQFYND